jgi:hypothetical protein
VVKLAAGGTTGAEGADLRNTRRAHVAAFTATNDLRVSGRAWWLARVLDDRLGDFRPERRGSVVAHVREKE